MKVFTVLFIVAMTAIILGFCVVTWKEASKCRRYEVLAPHELPAKIVAACLGFLTVFAALLAIANLT